MFYYVEYNGKYIAMYKRLSSALKFIKRKNLKNDDLNLLYLIDNKGNFYDPITGIEY